MNLTIEEEKLLKQFVHMMSKKLLAISSSSTDLTHFMVSIFDDGSGDIDFKDSRGNSKLMMDFYYNEFNQ